MIKIDLFKLRPRLGRIHYLALFLFWSLTASVGLSIPILFHSDHFLLHYAILFIAALIIIPATINTIYIQIRRLHDFDFQGWWLLLFFIPVINVLLNLSLFLMPGSKHHNRFGNPPAHPVKEDYILTLIELVIFSIFTFLLGSYIGLKVHMLSPMMHPPSLNLIIQKLFS